MDAAKLLPKDFIEDANRLIDSDNYQNVISINDQSNEFALLAAKCLIPQGIEITPPEVVFGIGGTPMLTKKSISLLIAKAKAGKTTVAAWIVAQAINQQVNVLWVDTEQGSYFGSRTQSWILQIAGKTLSKDLSFYDLKIHPPGVRVKLIEALIQSQSWDLVVIDGIRDLVLDINSPEQATNISTDLMRWSELFNCHVLTILHVNKGNDNARGHLGTEIVNKSETVIKVYQNEASEIIVEPEFSRGKSFETFALNRDGNGLPYLINGWMIAESSLNAESKSKTLLPTRIAKETHLEILNKVFKAQSEKKYKELRDSLKNEVNSWYGWSVSDAKIRTYIQYYLDQKLLTTKGSTPQTKYSISSETVTGLLI